MFMLVAGQSLDMQYVLAVRFCSAYLLWPFTVLQSVRSMLWLERLNSNKIGMHEAHA